MIPPHTLPFIDFYNNDIIKLDSKKSLDNLNFFEDFVKYIEERAQYLETLKEFAKEKYTLQNSMQYIKSLKNNLKKNPAITFSYQQDLAKLSKIVENTKSHVTTQGEKDSIDNINSLDIYCEKAIRYLKNLKAYFEHSYNNGRGAFKVNKDKLMTYRTGGFEINHKNKGQDDRLLEQKRWKIIRDSCKFGLLLAQQYKAKIHFILDGIDDKILASFFNQEPVPNSNYVPCTQIEFLYIFKNWNKLNDTVIFYRNNIAVDPPWMTKNLNINLAVNKFVHRKNIKYFESKKPFLNNPNYGNYFWCDFKINQNEFLNYFPD
ncbi:hypothetical protein EDC55_12417 [Allofrancisella inopinata]|uniref:Uncharacterized protein n=1 Tax=Allofrancisella inopinata TaxID=1085647 RepID=A0AAE7CRP8_9GAMM|nr:hypothetical protein [Allofrancisella inopinata]QIV96644.1 hypothetical protein E4K63_07300 [Allofrancisella inopinata]TDT67396.1 hypothetical protein EDC55_12417 [Allofrancisella inopinata]